MALHLVRHADAGNRPAWDQPDHLRPLSPGGTRQAERLAELLGTLPVQRVLSSRYVRCTETLAPLAARLGLAVEEHPALGEDAGVEETWALVEALGATDAVLCSHGNVIGAVLDRLHRRGVELEARDRACRKGSVWTLEVEPDGTFARCRLTVEKT
jgi:phosphohistidine phosphatase SixA